MLVHGEIDGMAALQKGIKDIGLNASIAKFKSTIDFDKEEYIAAEKSALPSKKETVGKLSVLAENVLQTLKNEEAMLKVEEVNKVKILLEIINDILADN